MRNKKRKTLLCSLGALIVLVVALVAVLNLSQDQEEEYEEGNFKILSLNIEKIVRFTFENDKSDEPVTFEYDSAWKYTGDADFQTNENLVKSALKVVDRLSSTRKLVDIADRLENYGLDKPQIRLQLTDSENNSQTLLLGNPNTVTGGYYMMEEGDDCAYMVDGDFISAFGNDVYNYGLVEEMPSISFDNLTDMRVERSDYNFHMFKDESGNELNESGYAKWFIDEPVKQLMGCDSNDVKEGLQSITGMTFAKMVDYKADKKELKNYGLDEPVRITLKYLAAVNTDETKSDETLKYEERILQVLVGKEHQNEDGDSGYFYCKVINYNGIQKVDTGAVGLIDAESITAAMNLNTLDYVYPQIALPVLDTVDRIEIYKEDEKILDCNITKIKASTQQNNADTSGIDDATDSKYDFEFEVNGIEMEEKAFKEDYKNLVSLKLENLYLEDEKIDDTSPAYTIIYHRSKGIKKITIKFHPYNKSYYAVEKNGVIQILSNKDKVNEILENLNALNLK